MFLYKDPILVAYAVNNEHMFEGYLEYIEETGSSITFEDYLNDVAAEDDVYWEAEYVR